MSATGMWPFRHLDLKLWSILLSAMLWMVIAGDESVERGIRVPLELQQFPAGLELQAEPPALIDVRVRGGSGVLSRVGPGDIVAVLDLRAARPGQRLYQITPSRRTRQHSHSCSRTPRPDGSGLFRPLKANRRLVS
jgi:hypothetical protein